MEETLSCMFVWFYLMIDDNESVPWGKLELFGGLLLGGGTKQYFKVL